MALRTNSRKARENVRQYILDNVDFNGYMMPYIEKTNFPKVAHNLLLIFKAEKCYEIEKIIMSLLFSSTGRRVFLLSLIVVSGTIVLPSMT